MVGLLDRLKYGIWIKWSFWRHNLLLLCFINVGSNPLLFRRHCKINKWVITVHVYDIKQIKTCTKFIYCVIICSTRLTYFFMFSFFRSVNKGIGFGTSSQQIEFRLPFAVLTFFLSTLRKTLLSYGFSIKIVFLFHDLLIIPLISLIEYVLDNLLSNLDAMA